jgi:predicted AlkP superfamily phosphohydrolase/phosphomutase
LIARLIEGDDLPTLERIAREGVHGPLRSNFPLWSPPIWTSIATGKYAAKHGIWGYVRARHRLWRSTDRKTHALWNIVSDAGLKVGVVNWWNTYPPEKIDGVMISDHLYPWQTEVRRRVLKAVKEDESSPIVFPESWRARVVAGLESDTPLTGISNLFEENESLPKWVKTEYLAGVFRSDTKVVKHALEVESAIDPDLLMVFLPGIDRVSHALWGSIEPPELYPEHLRLSGSAREAAAEALFGYYRYTDALIGRLCERYGENDLIMVVSDHGFEAGVSRVGGTGIHESRHARDGIIFSRGPGIPAGSKAWGRNGPMSVNDVTPTILAWLGLPVALDMDGRPAPFLEVEAPPEIPTHDTTSIEYVEARSPGAEAEIVEQLRQLGYIE